MKKFAKNAISYGTPALIVMAIGFIVLAVQGIWPFGSETVDYYDMGQQVAAECTQIWDELHGAKSSVFDWYLSLGREIPGGTSYSLLNVVFYFVSRNMILESFSIILVLKMMLMATAMRILLKNEIKDCPDFYSIVFSAGYGISGYLLMFYTMILWLDVAIIVPLVLMYAQRLIRDGKCWGFIICNALLLIENFYLPVMLLIFVFLETGLYLAIYGNKKRHLLRLGLSVLASLLISAWGWYPKVMYAAGSQRFSNEAGSGLLDQYLKIVTHVLPDYSTQWWTLLGVSFAAAITMIGLFYDLKNRNYKRLLFVIGSYVIVMSQFVFESIQLFWYFGSYVNYPARNGFLVCAVFAMSAATYAKEVICLDSEILTADKKTSKIKVFNRGVFAGYESETKTGLNMYVGVGLIIMVLLPALGIFWYQSNPGMSVYSVFRVSMIVVIVTFCIYFALVLFQNGRFIKLSVFLMIAELIFYGVLLVGKPTYITGYCEDPEQNGTYVKIARQLAEKMDIYSSNLDRIKNPDTSLNANYGLFLRRPTVAGWMPSTPGDIFDATIGLGYSNHYTRTLDSGGTVFSDALLHVTQVVSCTEQDEKLYRKTADAEIIVDDEPQLYSLYNCRYVLPFGMTFSDEALLEYDFEKKSITDVYNILFSAISRSDDNEKIAEQIALDIKGVPIDFTGQKNDIRIDGNKVLYLTGHCAGSEYQNVEINVNGESILIPTIQETDNSLYPAHFNNNCIYLGSFMDEDISFRIDIDKSVDAGEYEFELFTIDLDEMRQLCTDYMNCDNEFSATNRCLKAKVLGKTGEYLLLPVAFSDNFIVNINGEEKELLCVNGVFSAVELENGENGILLSYFPESMKTGIDVAAIFALLVIAYSVIVQLLKKNRMGRYAVIAVSNIKFECWADDVIGKVYPLIWGLFIICMYVIPTLYGLCFYIGMIFKR